MKRIVVSCLIALWSSFAGAQTAWEATGEGFITDASHPSRPGDFKTYQVRVRVALDEGTGEALIEFSSKLQPQEPPDRYYWRRGRLFQTKDAADDLPPEKEGDLAPAALALIHPALVSALLKERPENASSPAPNDASRRMIANSDVLWEATFDRAEGSVHELKRSVHEDVRGSCMETVAFDANVVSVNRGTRTLARIQFGQPQVIDKVRTPKGDPRRDDSMVIPPEDFSFRDMGGGLFACELAGANCRVFVVEFTDHLAVFEGVYTTRNAETLSKAIQTRFKKPVRYFAFSHIHGQYIGGIRAWAAQGATIVVPPSTEPLAREVLAASFEARPDAWSRMHAPASLKIVEDRMTLEDDSASVQVLNDKVSEHTDEYLLLYFPRTRTLLTGDLLFFRPGKPLSGRSLRLAKHVESLGLTVDRCVTTWPLQWPGVLNEVSGEQLRLAATP